MPPPRDLADDIRAHVVREGLRPGDRLPPERVLAGTLGVSRPALREATRRLVDVGVLISRQGSGTYVARIDPAQLLVVRRRLEPLAAELAARHAAPEDRDAITGLVAELADAVDDAERFAELDLALHARIAAASGNDVLVRILEDLDQLMRLSRARTAVDPRTRARSLRQLTVLADAIAAKDAEAAAAAMDEHLAGIGAALGA